jgi:hypothetical protein
VTQWRTLSSQDNYPAKRNQLIFIPNPNPNSLLGLN